MSPNLQTQKRVLNPQQSALIAAIAVALFANLIPFVQGFLLPLTYLNTHLHELCHALMAVATGGSVESISVNSDGSGTTPVLGGNQFLVASAGYTGATVLGSAMILLGSTPTRAKRMMGVLACILAMSIAIWVRGDVIGVASGLLWVAVLGACAMLLRGNAALFFCQFLGLEQCLNSLRSVYELLKMSTATEVHSDATILQSISLVPALFWAFLWCLFSALLLGVTARLVWKNPGGLSSPT